MYGCGVGILLRSLPHGGDRRPVRVRRAAAEASPVDRGGGCGRTSAKPVDLLWTAVYDDAREARPHMRRDRRTDLGNVLVTQPGTEPLGERFQQLRGPFR